MDLYLCCMNPFKKCNKCSKEKDRSFFFKNKENKDGLHSWCKECLEERRLFLISQESPLERAKRLKEKAEYASGRRPVYNKTCNCCGAEFISKYKRKLYCSEKCKRKGKPDKQERNREYTRNRYKQNMLWLSNYKLESGCVDCGYNKHPEALQLDHEGVKKHEIANLRHTISRLKEEIENGKCVVRCANCHAIKTLERKKQKNNL